MKIVKLRDVKRALKGTKIRKTHILDTRKPPDVKLKLYMAQLFSDLKHFFEDKRKRSIKSQTDIEKSSIEIQTDRDEVRETAPTNRKIIEHFPQLLRKNAEILLSKMGKVMSWNSENRIIYKGKIIPDSNIRELCDYLLRRRSEKFRPKYFGTLKTDLSKLDIGYLCPQKLHEHNTRYKRRRIDDDDDDDDELLESD
jgi:hypothetical protein